VFNLTSMDPPRALQICEEAPLALATLVRGSAWVRRDIIEPVRLSERDAAVFTGPSPYVLGDQPDTEPQLRIHRAVLRTVAWGTCRLQRQARRAHARRTSRGRGDGCQWHLSDLGRRRPAVAHGAAVRPRRTGGPRWRAP